MLVLGVGVLFGTVVAAVAMSDSAEAPVVAPMLAQCGIAFAFLFALHQRDGQLPVFDVGAVCMTATLLYATVPLLGFWGGGLSFDIPSDYRLVLRDPSPEEVGMFAWRYVVHMAALMLAYLLVRRDGVPCRSAVGRPPPEMVHVLCLAILLCVAYLSILQVVTGFSFSVSYAEMRSGGAPRLSHLPLIVQQITHNTHGVLFILKLGVLILLFQKYQNRYWRTALFGWLACELFFTATRLGARTTTVLLMLAAVLLYHRMVRRLTPLTAGLIGVGGLALFLGIGFARDYASDAPGYLGIVSTSNEFQAMFATAYDVYMMKVHEQVHIPWQLHVADLLRPIPQQFLPFEKIDPSGWYLDKWGSQQIGGGFMFGTIAEGVIALDWISIGLQGAAIGVMLGAVHRWYVKRSAGFLATIAYLWLCVYAYYTFRASTLYILTWAVYRLLPAIALLAGGSALLRIAVGRWHVRAARG